MPGLAEDKKIVTISPPNRTAWRNWLEKNQHKKDAVWLLYHKKSSSKTTVTYIEAVEEALCFGWIDSRTNPVDEKTYVQFFCKRKAKSIWSKINKARIERLIAEGLMTKTGLDVIEAAKANGSWSALDEVEELIIPADLTREFRKWKNSKKYFIGLSKSTKRNILQWLTLAKRAETRQGRIVEIASLAAQSLKPKQFR